MRAVPRDRQWYQALLDDLYDSVEGLDVSAYRWSDSDGWERSRAPQVEDAPLQHLECWVDLGAPSMPRGSMIDHDARLIWAVRYQPDDDALSQGICHASIDDVRNLLNTWGRTDGARTRWQRATITAAAAEWLVVESEFTLSYPWRA